MSNPSYLSPTTLSLSSTLCISLGSCAITIRTTSCLKWSNLFNASSMSILPKSLLVNIPGHRLAYIHVCPGIDTLARFRLISFVAIAEMLRTSAIIVTIMSAISVVAAVGGTSV
ncbi:hypothetical protein H4582DRAFT_1463327 [Lactarius indigo]|nr:hypothetical protein H4582DRAFT_1463327 [Lactarius indigo]